MPFCLRIAQICNDYLGRGLDAIVYHAIIAYNQKHRGLAKDGNEVLAELVADVTARLEGFIKDVRELRKTVTRMGIIVKHTGPASFLEELSANPICRHILSQMESNTKMVGGQLTPIKELFGQQCWSDAKLNNFFSSLRIYLTATFQDFNVVSTSQIELEALLLDLRVQILQDPDFGKKELSPVEMVIKEVLLDIKMDKLRALATPNVRGA